MKEAKIDAWIESLCAYAGENAEFAGDFAKRLKRDEEICQEFCAYMETGSFACKAQIRGYTVVDVMVWQMDHFKARLDRDNTGTRQNGDRMLLLAFDTMLKMREDPEAYIQRMQSETGTDYPGKY